MQNPTLNHSRRNLLIAAAAVTAGAGSIQVASANSVSSSAQPINLYDTLADAKASSTLQSGEIIRIKERIANNGGGGLWQVVDSSAVTTDDFTTVQCTSMSQFALSLCIEDNIIAKQVGVTFDGTTDDAPAWLHCFKLFKSFGLPIIGDSGTSMIEQTLSYDTTSEGITKGLILKCPGSKTCTFVNNITGGGPLLELTSGASAADFQFAGNVSGFRITQSNANTNSNAHGIVYRGTWRQKFSDIEMDNLNGSGFKAVNTTGDFDSSAFVEFDFVRANDCAGPGFDSINSSGGLAHHTLSNYHFENCGGAIGNVVLDGVGHFNAFNQTLVANPSGPRYSDKQVGIRIQNSQITPFNITIEKGEIGNSLYKCIVVDAGLNITMGGFRLVKRTGENTMISGIEISDGSFSAQNITIHPIFVAFDDAKPVTTLFKIGSGSDGSNKIYAPQINAFDTDNQYLGFTGGAENKGDYIEHQKGGILFNRRLKRLRHRVNSAAELPLDLTTGNWQQFLLSDTSAAYTIKPPINGNADGAEFTLGIWNVSGLGSIAVNFEHSPSTGHYINSGGFVPPGPGLYTEAVFRYDSDSQIWRVTNGGWSTPA